MSPMMMLMDLQIIRQHLASPPREDTASRKCSTRSLGSTRGLYQHMESETSRTAPSVLPGQGSCTRVMERRRWWPRQGGQQSRLMLLRVGRAEHSGELEKGKIVLLLE